LRTLATAVMVMNVALSIVLTEAVGVPGAVWGSVIAVAICVFAPRVLCIRRSLHDELAISAKRS
jgi:hypothetical protein